MSRVILHSGASRARRCSVEMYWPWSGCCCYDSHGQLGIDFFCKRLESLRLILPSIYKDTTRSIKTISFNYVPRKNSRLVLPTRATTTKWRIVLMAVHAAPPETPKPVFLESNARVQDGLPNKPECLLESKSCRGVNISWTPRPIGQVEPGQNKKNLSRAAELGSSPSC